MAIKYIDYQIDANGYIKRLNEEKIRQTEHNIHRLRFYSELETQASTEYKARITFTRADGLTIGPLVMAYAQDDNGNWHRYYDIKEKLTEITGALSYAVSYDQETIGEDGHVALIARYPSFTITSFVYDANNSVYDEHYDIYRRMEAVETIANLALNHTTEIQVSEEPPSNMNKIWFKIL